MPWASYRIRKIAGRACAGNAGNAFSRRRLQRKPLVSDPGMHHGTCVTHVPWCMSGSLTRGGGENVPGIPGACAPAILPIWQDARYQNQCWSTSVIQSRSLSSMRRISATFTISVLINDMKCSYISCVLKTLKHIRDEKILIILQCFNALMYMQVFWDDWF